MTTSRRLVAASAAALVGAALAAAPAVQATPSAGGGLQPLRSFSLSTGAGFARLEVQLVQVRAGVRAGTSPSVSSGGERWSGCVHGWTRDAFFHDCGDVTGLQVDVAEGSADGRIRFTVRDDFWGDTAQVDLALADRGQVPDVDVSAPAYPYELGVSAAPQAWVTRQASASGNVVIRTVRKKAVERRHVVAAGTAATVRDAIMGSVGSAV